MVPPNLRCAMALSALIVLAAGSHAATHTISGSVNYREKIALTEGAAVFVDLVSLKPGSGGKREVVASIRLVPNRQVPIPFKLTYDSRKLRRGVSYGITATIFERASMKFESSKPTPVSTTKSMAGIQLILGRVASANRGEGGRPTVMRYVQGKAKVGTEWKEFEAWFHNRKLNLISVVEPNRRSEYTILDEDLIFVSERSTLEDGGRLDITAMFDRYTRLVWSKRSLNGQAGDLTDTEQLHLRRTFGSLRLAALRLFEDKKSTRIEIGEEGEGEEEDMDE